MCEEEIKCIVKRHKCEKLSNRDGIQIRQIKFDDYDAEWFLGVCDIKLAITHCPYCGKKLE